MGRRWSVETVPPWALPGFWLYGYGFGVLWIFLFVFVRLTCRVEVINESRIKNLPSVIFCLWHDRVIAFFSVFIFHRFKKHVWLNHPDAYMKPIHIVIRFLGVEKLILGSTGNDGRIAADRLLTYLKKGYSSFINPDGPYGPKYHCKKGCFHLAKQSQVPLVPLELEVTPCWHLPGWDRKIVPIPFISKIKIIYI